MTTAAKAANVNSDPVGTLGVAIRAWSDLAERGDPLAREMLWILAALRTAARRDDLVGLKKKLGPSRWARSYLKRANAWTAFVRPMMAPDSVSAVRWFLEFCADQLETLIGPDRMHAGSRADVLQDVKLGEHLRDDGASEIASTASKYMRPMLVASGVELPEIALEEAHARAEQELLGVANRDEIKPSAIASACLRGWGFEQRAIDGLVKSARRGTTDSKLMDAARAHAEELREMREADEQDWEPG